MAATRLNIHEQEESHYQNAYNINKDRLFVPKIEDPLDTVIDMFDDGNVQKRNASLCTVSSPNS